MILKSVLAVKYIISIYNSWIHLVEFGIKRSEQFEFSRVTKLKMLIFAYIAGLTFAAFVDYDGHNSFNEHYANGVSSMKQMRNQQSMIDWLTYRQFSSLDADLRFENGI